MAKLCNAARVFFRAQPGGTGRNFTQSHRYSPLAELLCRAPPASFRLKSATVVGAKQVLTDPGSPAGRSMRFACYFLQYPAMQRNDLLPLCATSVDNKQRRE
jgi:hypothetical protein